MISEVLYQYQSKDRRLQFKIIRPEEFDTDLSLENAVDACDIYIEQVSASCTGDLGLLALSRGKTVLSGNSSELQMDWPATKFSPVLHTDAKTLYSRLQAIVREPRCLRDFGKRSREFIRNQHRPDSIGKLLIDYYGSLAAKNAQNQAYLELLL
ncbi:MAG: hypothetical protein DCC75_13745 [Proteobacteria bacterium]|nr:MAG: hypothetical protein DCC75_13745 [Pseudomonadota bacterium]